MSVERASDRAMFGTWEDKMDDEKKATSESKSVEQVQKPAELSAEELEQVTGGCSSGKHIAKLIVE